MPVIDVDSNVTQQHLPLMWPIFQELLASFASLNYVHVGPRLASLLIQPENLDSNLSINETIETDMSELFKSYSCLQELWHILNLNATTTLLLCSNGLHSKSEFHSIPSNVILVEYGFQVGFQIFISTHFVYFYFVLYKIYIIQLFVIIRITYFFI